ncbi:NADH dehydrogenase [ubiquinone] 1 alpha subcomplex subunit 10, mitochondrial [Prorops nasuta]|uniref:NADH dehydrogenase [ubiquinone] 1 alpha subcomplex subunit 10, mitochondrial n=1 Tax=Prorops nasuta TaxID=863751 RepID=UPI0034D00975
MAFFHASKALLKPMNPQLYKVATLFRMSLKEDRDMFHATRGRPRSEMINYLNEEFGYSTYKYDQFYNANGRYDKNSKLISIEGPIAAGKSELAAAIAKDYEFLYMKPPSFDDVYIDSKGRNMRDIDHLLPKNCQLCTLERLFLDPTHPASQWTQYHFFKLKLSQIMLANLHILSTGLGVVMERAVTSDFVFMQTLKERGVISDVALDRYISAVHMARMVINRPHIIIYLDVPVDEVEKRIKARNIPFEVNSKLLDTKFLSSMHTKYEDFLRRQSPLSTIMMYDWSDNDGVPRKTKIEKVLEDLEHVWPEPVYPSRQYCDWVYGDWNDIYNQIVYLQRNWDVDTIDNELMSFNSENDFSFNFSHEDFIKLVSILKEKYKDLYDPDYGQEVELTVRNLVYNRNSIEEIAKILNADLDLIDPRNFTYWNFDNNGELRPRNFKAEPARPSMFMD